MTISFTLRPWQVVLIAFILGATAALSGVVVAGLLLTSHSDEDDATPALVEPSITPAAAAAVASAPTVRPLATPVPPTQLPDRQNCDEIRGTDYRSESEREWFGENCRPQPVVTSADQRDLPFTCNVLGCLGSKTTSSGCVAEARTLNYGRTVDDRPGLTDVSILGTYRCLGQRVSGVLMAARWGEGPQSVRCDAATDIPDGVAGCSRIIQKLVPGQLVSVDVCFTHEGLTTCLETAILHR
jgi:hypothetical protein